MGNEMGLSRKPDGGAREDNVITQLISEERERERERQRGERSARVPAVTVQNVAKELPASEAGPKLRMSAMHA
jgi:hypothetical protein